VTDQQQSLPLVSLSLGEKVAGAPDFIWQPTHSHQSE